MYIIYASFNTIGSSAKQDDSEGFFQGIPRPATDRVKGEPITVHHHRLQNHQKIRR